MLIANTEKCSLSDMYKVYSTNMESIQLNLAGDALTVFENLLKNDDADKRGIKFFTDEKNFPDRVLFTRFSNPLKDIFMVAAYDNDGNSTIYLADTDVYGNIVDFNTLLKDVDTYFSDPSHKVSSLEDMDRETKKRIDYFNSKIS